MTPSLRRGLIPIGMVLTMGCWSLLHLYQNNWQLVNTNAQLRWMLQTFLLLPVLSVVFILFMQRYIRIKWLALGMAFAWIPVVVIIAVTGSVAYKTLALSGLVGAAVGYLVRRHAVKVLLLEVVVLFTAFVSYVFAVKIETGPEPAPGLELMANIAVTDERPNIYVLQPDGYVSPATLRKQPYALQEATIQAALEQRGFSWNLDFESNYDNTLESNASLFRAGYLPESRIALRKAIVQNNNMLRFLKEHGYRAHLVTDTPYLIMNGIAPSFDTYSFQDEDLPPLNRAFRSRSDTLEELGELLATNDKQSRFVFMERLVPGHVAVHESNSDGVEGERIKYVNAISDANAWIIAAVDSILASDKSAVILILADHGGFVGLSTSTDTREALGNEILLRSIYSAAYALRLPDAEAPQYALPNSTVNVFPHLLCELFHCPNWPDQMLPDKRILSSSE